MVRGQKGRSRVRRKESSLHGLREVFKVLEARVRSLDSILETDTLSIFSESHSPALAVSGLEPRPLADSVLGTMMAFSIRDESLG